MSPFVDRHAMPILLHLQRPGGSQNRSGSSS
jgi:hypothetical protein